MLLTRDARTDLPRGADRERVHVHEHGHGIAGAGPRCAHWPRLAFRRRRGRSCDDHGFREMSARDPEGSVRQARWSVAPLTASG